MSKFCNVEVESKFPVQWEDANNVRFTYFIDLTWNMYENSEINLEDGGDYFDCVTDANEQDGDLPPIYPSLSVLPRKQSLYLTFPENKLDCADKLLNENLLFYKTNKSKQNELFSRRPMVPVQEPYIKQLHHCISQDRADISGWKYSMICMY